ncbi:stage V sporulation protein AA [Paraliobacillus quinghaiensis]|uniref:Stage V sporulation protein AA n=1 Tax=Paraliobacillus quinghaiensis TaxID=470815 RepID=A0A917TIV5_9BACI|nr:stage V sporulation protein AA [Paraliobacillus quinghaiensis]GGM22424.1 stage V sporulation protein AA [Paraliobacillus quinghaiensis]
MDTIVYLRMKKNINIESEVNIKLEDISYISGEPSLVSNLKSITIHKPSKQDQQIFVIEAFSVIQKLQQLLPHVNFQLLGPNQTLIHIIKKNKKAKIPFVLVIWILLFVGSAMTIMNFHFDVSMQAVQQRLHYLFTGEEQKRPLWMQIPYSIGLGLGMILFFNHLFKKKFNEEPSPLEIEMFKYQQNIDQYVNHYENNLNNPDDK